MKQIEVTFKTPSGIEAIRRVNTSGRASAAAATLAKNYRHWEVVSYKTVKKWNGD